MLYRKTPITEGEYVNSNGERYMLEECVSVRPLTSDWVSFDTRAACLEAWGLTYDPASPLQGYAEAGPPSPLQGFGVASPLPEPEGEQG